VFVLQCACQQCGAALADDRAARPPMSPRPAARRVARADLTPKRNMLNPDQTRQWQQDGYLVLPGFKPAAEVAAACQRAQALVAAFEPAAHTGVFSTRDRSRVADAALLASAEAVHCFFEEEAFGPDGQLRVPKAQSINKIGHALHLLDPVFRAFSHGPELAALARALGLRQPQVWQSQLIFKQPHIGGEVGWHQDGSFFLTTPQTVTTFWFALEDATLDNGCLWVQPGGQTSPLREQYVCERPTPGSDEGARLLMRALDPTPWPDGASAVPLPVAAGTLVVFGGLLPHYSAPNRSPRSRLAYTLHATCGTARYAPENWLQRSPACPVRGFEASH
jgi:phytanoyl-CoA hydroxylase